MGIYLTSDLHFGHANVIGFCDRPFDTVDEMNEALVQLWNETVGVKDTVWVLGDIVMGKRAETLKYVTRLNGTKVLIPGNHDYCHPMNKKHTEWTPKYIEAGFGAIWAPKPDNTSVSVNFQGVNAYMNHFPHALGEYDDRDFDKWAPKDDGTPLIHGHVHNTWKVNKNQVNVGCDVWDLKPVHLDTILEIINGM